LAESTKERKGHCLCGAIKVTATQSSNTVGACHCATCRRWASGPFMEINCGTDVSFEGEEHLRIHASSAWAERGFCSKCGSNLFYRLLGSGQHMVSVALFEPDDEMVFGNQVFIDEKPDFYSFANKTEDMTGAECFAKSAPPAES